ncbi:MAG TPA: NUDIX domain-containing protein [archaeon]|nr:NUDIX domain-containing protein [archaeon]
MTLIHKIAAVVINDNKFLMVRKVGKDMWTSLGGRIEPNETEEQCLLREIKEEANCGAKIIRKLGDFEDKAVFDDATVRLSVFLVELSGDIEIIDPELEEHKFIGSNYKQDGIKLPPSIENQVIPLCIKEGLLRW